MTDAPAPEAPASKLKSPLVLGLIGLALAVGLYFVIDYVVEVFTHESTDDAFIAGHIVSLAPRVSGQVTAVNVVDNQMVNSNDLLVEVDPADYNVALAEKTAAADSQRSNYKTMLAAWQLMQTKVGTARDDVQKTKADADAAGATAVKAKLDYDRAVELRKQNTISQSEIDTAKAVNDQAQAAWKSAQENAAESVSKVDEANRTLDAAEAEAETAMAQWQQSETNIAESRLNLSYTKIFAPAAGRITRKAVEAGDYVQTGQQLMSIVPVDVWVVANFKESQLRDMHPGQPVSVAIDALGGREFRAHVDSIQAGSGAQFSLLPPENATGNFVKVIQRVPVKIIFDEALPSDHVIGPGLTVTPSVQTSQYVMPAALVVLCAIIGAALLIFLFVLVTGRKAAK